MDNNLNDVQVLDTGEYYKIPFSTQITTIICIGDLFNEIQASYAKHIIVYC